MSSIQTALMSNVSPRHPWAFQASMRGYEHQICGICFMSHSVCSKSSRGFDRLKDDLSHPFNSICNPLYNAIQAASSAVCLVSRRVILHRTEGHLCMCLERRTFLPETQYSVPFGISPVPRRKYTSTSERNPAAFKRYINDRAHI
jgi:hypothetical protein